jgi:hypothetical protein
MLCRGAGVVKNGALWHRGLWQSTGCDRAQGVDGIGPRLYARPMAKALITGITGQDGAYLAQWLLQQGYEVVGLMRRSASSDAVAERLRWLGILADVRTRRGEPR